MEDNANTSTTSNSSKEKVSDKGETVTTASAPLNKNSSATSESVDNVLSYGLDNGSAAEEPYSITLGLRGQTRDWRGRRAGGLF